MAQRKVSSGASARRDPSVDDEVAFADDGEPAVEAIGEALDEETIGRVCLACGSAGTGRDACEHREVAHFASPSRAVSQAVLRVRRAASELRAATRALHALTASEHAAGRAEIELAPPKAIAEGDCPRCVARTAELVASVTSAPPRARRRGRETPAGQHALPFADEGEPTRSLQGGPAADRSSATGVSNPH